MITFIERLDVNYPIILDVISHRSIARSQSSDFHAGLDILDEFLPLLSDNKSNSESKLPWVTLFSDKSDSTTENGVSKSEDNKFLSFFDSINPIELMKGSNSNSGSNRITSIRDTRTKHNATPSNNGDKSSIPPSTATTSNSIEPLPGENLNISNASQPETANSISKEEPELYIDSEDEDDTPQPQRVDIIPPSLPRGGEYPLHRAVFAGNHDLVCTLLKQGFSSASIDIHGNTPLHIASMIGCIECCSLLTSFGSPVNAKNRQGWNPLHEAISYGNRHIIYMLLRTLKDQARTRVRERRFMLQNEMETMPDFSLRLTWEFRSWVPLLTRVLPADVCTVRKRGTRLRLDSSLMSFGLAELTWRRGDLTFLFNAPLPAASSLHGNKALSENVTLLVLDNKARVYQPLIDQETDREVQMEVDSLMTSDIAMSGLCTEDASTERVRSGLFFAKSDKTVEVCGRSAELYSVRGLCMRTQKRREHLSAELIKRNKQLLQALKTRGPAASEIAELRNETNRSVHVSSLRPPARSSVTWSEYASAPKGKPPAFGRTPIASERSTPLEAEIAMVKDFPLSLENFLLVLEAIAPYKKFKNLRKFLLHKLPPGFPLQIELPVVPTINARVSVESFEVFAPGSSGTSGPLNEALFEVPPDYREDLHWFPDL